MGASEPSRRGGFVVVEGLDGAGKSAVVRAVVDALGARGCAALATREPGGTRVGEELRDVFLSTRAGAHDEVCAAAELLIVLAARAQHLKERVRPALSRGEWIVSDRFNDSTYAYQGGGRRVDPATIREIERLAGLDEPAPDLVLLLDLPVETALRRLSEQRPQRGLLDAPNGDRFSAKRADFLERVRDAYLARARAEPRRYRVLDARRSAAKVRRDASAAVLDACGGALPALAPA